MALEKQWIPVITSEGMFSNERSISLELKNGNFVSFFADSSLIKKEGNNSFLQVMVVDIEAQLVLLPTETFETSSPWAEIKHWHNLK